MYRANFAEKGRKQKQSLAAARDDNLACEREKPEASAKKRVRAMRGLMRAA